MLWKPFYINGCETSFSDADVVSLKKYVESLHELRIYDTATFFTQIKEDVLPNDTSKKPLRDYKELQEDWNILWKMVKALRSSDPRAAAGTTERRKINSRKQKAFVKKVFDELHRNEARNRGEDNFIAEVSSAGDGTVGRESNKGSNGSNLSNSQQLKQNTGRKKIAKPGRRNVVDDPQVQEEVSSLIENNKYITIAEIAIETGLAKTTIYHIIDRLKNREKRRLVRRGSKNKGYWKFLKEGVEQLSNKEIQRRRRENVLFFIRENSQIKIAQLASKIGLSSPAISNIIRELKDGDYLVREGSHLKVLKGGEQYYDL